MGLRERRLESDLKAVARLCAPGAPIELVEVIGMPAERYQLRYRVPGLVVQNGVVVPADVHLVEVYLTLSYPRQAPQCRMLSPIFHPNIAPHAICVGDHWSAGEPLAGLLVRIAEMICFQSYNVQSPLNGDAARWADQHAGELPLLSSDFTPLLSRHQGEDIQIPEGVHRPASAPPPGLSEGDSAAPRVEPIEAPPIIAPVLEAAVLSVGPAVTCTACGAVLTLGRETPGLWARCPMCGQMLPVRHS